MAKDLRLARSLIKKQCFMEEKINGIFVQFYNESPGFVAEVRDIIIGI